MNTTEKQTLKSLLSRLSKYVISRFKSYGNDNRKTSNDLLMLADEGCLTSMEYYLTLGFSLGDNPLKAMRNNFTKFKFEFVPHNQLEWPEERPFKTNVKLSYGGEEREVKVHTVLNALFLE